LTPLHGAIFTKPDARVSRVISIGRVVSVFPAGARFSASQTADDLRSGQAEHGAVPERHEDVSRRSSSKAHRSPKRRPAAEGGTPPPSDDELRRLQQELEEMQRRLGDLARKKPAE